MVGRLRVARLDPSAHVPLAPDMAATPELHRRLTTVIRRHLPPVTASLLTLPKPTADGRFIEWYSDLAGQPVALPDLPETEQAAARTLLRERVASVRDLANRLPSLDPEAADLAEPLRQALSYPAEATVYVVGGQPVLTFWGYASAAPPSPPPAVPPDPSPVTETRARGGLPWWLWLLLAALLAAALAIGAWWYYRDRLCPPWADCQGLYEAALADAARLEDRVRDLEAELRRRLDLCRLQENLAAARRDERDLLQRAVNLQANLAASMQLCPLKARVQAAATDGLALQAQSGEAEARLARALDECRRRAEEQARLQAETAARRKAEEERRKQEVTSPGEDLKIPESACRTGSTEFFNGRWKTTAQDLKSTGTGAPIVFFLDVRNATGQRTLFEYNRGGRVRCVAPIRIRMDQCRLIIEDTRRMRCESGSEYEFTRLSCSAGADRRATCIATQETHPVESVEIERLK